MIENVCFLVDADEFSEVHNFIKKDDVPIPIGTLSFEEGQVINIGVNSLFASHIGILGNTGSGKSYTLAKIYSELFKKFGKYKNFQKNGKFLLFDFNGEFSSEHTITNGKKIYHLTTKKEIEDISLEEKIPLSEEDLIDLELISILSNATEKTQKPFISRALDFYRKVEKEGNSLEYFKNTLKNRIRDVLKTKEKEKANTLIGYLISILGKEGDNLSEEVDNQIEWNNTYSYFMQRDGACRELNSQEIEDNILISKANDYEFPNNILSKIIHFLYLQIIYDVFYNKAQNEHISHAINRLKSKQTSIEKVLNTDSGAGSIFSNENFVVINLKDVNLEIKKTLPLIVSKKIYSEHKQKYSKHANKFLNVIIDEAHNILSKESNREAESWKDYRLETFEEIIKEGRKFGVFLTIASQRPSDISPTIISQLHNFFLHRLINNNDILAIEKNVSYLDKVSFEYLSLLPTGTCIMAGLLAQVPIIIDIGLIEPVIHEPDSKTIKLTDWWK